MNPLLFIIYYNTCVIMSEFTSESAILHLKEHWNDIKIQLHFQELQNYMNFMRGNYQKVK